MFCTKCGKDNGEGNKFCIECGTPLEEEGSTGASPEDTVDVFATAPVNNDANMGSDNSTTILGDSVLMRLIADDGAEFDVESLPAIVGKGSKADVIVPGDESISRQHFCIHENGNDGFVIEELGATNKTYLNDNVLEKEELVVLNDGDKIKAGQTILTVQLA